jgi:hypothetical protein
MDKETRIKAHQKVKSKLDKYESFIVEVGRF